MKTKRKFLSLLLAVSMLLVTACGSTSSGYSNDDDDDDDDDDRTPYERLDDDIDELNGKFEEAIDGTGDINDIAEEDEYFLAIIDDFRELYEEFENIDKDDEEAIDEMREAFDEIVDRYNAYFGIEDDDDGGDANDAIANKKAGEIAKEFKAPVVPDNVSFEGKQIRILGMERLVEGANGTEEAPVGAVAQELYDRNRRCEERFGITITFTNHQTGWQTSIPNAVKQSVQSGSNDYEVVFATASVQTPLINSGMYLPITMYDKYIDLSQPWWNDDYIYSVSLTDAAPYALFGNLTYNQVERTAAIFANTTKFADMFNILPEDLFGHVLDGSWTLDKFTEYVNMGYRDLNGTGKPDVGDMYGLTVTSMAINFMAYGAGLEFTKRDYEGFPVLNLNTPDAQKLNEKLVNLFSGNKAVQNIGNAEHVSEFGKGNALFMANRLFIAGWSDVRQMEDDFIILPYPKFDERIDGYHSVVENNVQWGCVMSTVPDEDLDMISAAMEQMCFDGYTTVTPLYYENDLKLNYSRGDDVDTQSKVLDMIVDGARTDFLFVNNVGTIGGVFHNSVMTGRADNFTSYYASNKNKAMNELEDMINDYRRLGI